MTERINLKRLITKDHKSWDVLDENGKWLKINPKWRPVTDGFNGNGSYENVVPEGETEYISLNDNFYTEKGLRYWKLSSPSVTDVCHLVYPYRFRNSNGKEVAVKDMMLGVEPIMSAVVDIWVL